MSAATPISLSTPSAQRAMSANSHYDYNEHNVPILTLGNLNDKIAPGPPDAFALELSRLQEEQINIGRKIEKEQHRKETLDNDIIDALAKLRAIQDKTKNGSIVKELDMANKKQIGRLEHHLQMSKIKLSVSRNENSTLKKKVQEQRRDKMLHLQIYNSLVKEANEARRKLKYQQKEIAQCNERKHKAKVAVANIKNKMLKDMEDFSHELNLAKQNISNAQTSIIAAMREKMATVQLSPSKYNTAEAAMLSRTAAAMQEAEQAQTRAELANQTDMYVLLQEAGVKSTEELIIKLEGSEEQMFALYSETQMKEDEMEQIEVDNKHLEQQVELQLSRLHALEGHHEEVKQELEKSIQQLRTQIAKYDAEYAKNMEVLRAIADNLMNLLRNVAADEAAADQQLLSAGVNDRNVGDFLGLIEQRIDDLIQMSKAAQHQSIRRDDFLRVGPSSSAEPTVAFRAPHLPSLADGADDEDELDETIKLQPINIQVLKELMAKKVQSAPKKVHHKQSTQMGYSGSRATLRSQSSVLSLKSAGSGNGKF